MTNWTEAKTIDGLLSQANASAPFWTMMLFMMWVILVVTFLPFGTLTAVMGGSFIAFLIGLFLVYMGLVEWYWVLGLFALSIAVIIWNTLQGGKE